MRPRPQRRSRLQQMRGRVRVRFPTTFSRSNALANLEPVFRVCARALRERGRRRARQPPLGSRATRGRRVKPCRTSASRVRPKLSLTSSLRPQAAAAAAAAAARGAARSSTPMASLPPSSRRAASALCSSRRCAAPYSLRRPRSTVRVGGCVTVRAHTFAFGTVPPPLVFSRARPHAAAATRTCASGH